MAVAYDAISKSHASGSSSASESSFSWTHTPVGTPKGVLVFVFSNTTVSNDNSTSVTYGGTNLTAVSGGRAVVAGTRGGDVKAWFLGSSISTGNQTITVNRTNNADQMWAQAYTVTAAADTSVHTAGIVLIQAGVTLVNQQAVTDGQSSGTNNSLRFAAINANNSVISTTWTKFTMQGTIYPGPSSTMNATNGYNSLTNYSLATVYETTAGIGSRNIGFYYDALLVKGVTSHTVAVHLAVKESGGGGGGTTNPAALLAMMVAQEAANERITTGGIRGYV